MRRLRLLPAWLAALPCLAVAMLCPAAALAQVPTTSEAQVVAAALANPVNLGAATLGVQQQQALLGAAANYDNLQVVLATDPYDPLELGVDQVFDFPTAYGRRRSLQRASIGLAEKALTVSQYEVKRRAREAYLQLQLLGQRIQQLQFQDSLYQAISAAAGRAFKAGQTTKLEQQFADNRYNNVHNQLARARSEFAAQQQQLKVFTGLAAVVPTNWERGLEAVPTTSLPASPLQALAQQQVEVSRNVVAVAKADALPGFITGVSVGLAPQQADRGIGFRAGVSLPLFLGQNRARIRSAAIGVQLAEAQANATNQAINQEYAMASATLQRELESLRYYEQTALPQADEIIITARRLFAAGQLSYIEYLRNVAEAFDNKLNHLQTQRDYRQALIDVQFLNGTL